MASNDTNSWDEDPHALMRQRWQQAFADHRMPARPDLTRRIFDSLNAGRRRRWAYRTVKLLGSLLLLLGGGVGLNPLVERPGRSTGQTNRIESAQPVSMTGQTLPQPRAIDARADRGIEQQRTAATTLADRKDIHPVLPTEGVTRPGITRPTRFGGKPTPVYRVAAKETSSKRSTRFDLPGKRPSVQDNPVPDEYLVSPNAQLTDQSQPDILGAAVSGPMDRVVWERLKPLSLLPPTGTFDNHLRLPSALDVTVQHLTRPVTARRSGRWFAEITQLSHFQLMTAPPNATAYLSSVGSPAAFSPTTWGVQMAGGLRWSRWQLHGSIGYLRRWAYYTVSENSYHLRSAPDNAYQLVRETYAVAENKRLPLVGLGVSQQQLLFRGRYAAELGGQISYLPTINQSLLALRGGIARQLPLVRGVELRVKLKVDYGLNQLRDEANQLTLRPLMVGIGIQVQPRPK
ncbi:hypothetical protein [Spirosoma sordidisoli]|uniref:Uncharacterized protein n=1 Tax=Spirosoma sordidisoli TaxID=2502893 RepID=A0A4Q2UK05_9BACT|nr:hypothetical protein [Spirosoma sordidisoli]RYC69843.1 hypothetical protein EQG79_14725 [Spirosoma sordidisoli]